jgi:hypothetical protein
VSQVPSEEAVELGSVGETGTTHAHVLEETEVLDLMLGTGGVPVVVGLVVVGLDATDVVRRAPREGVHERVARGLELEAGSGGALLLQLLGVLGEPRDEQSVLALLDHGNQIVEQGVLVLLAEALGLVRHLQVGRRAVNNLQWWRSSKTIERQWSGHSTSPA